MKERLFICDYYKDCIYRDSCFHVTEHVHGISCVDTCDYCSSSKCVDFLVLQRRDKLDKLEVVFNLIGNQNGDYEGR